MSIGNIGKAYVQAYDAAKEAAQTGGVSRAQTASNASNVQQTSTKMESIAKFIGATAGKIMGSILGKSASSAQAPAASVESEIMSKIVVMQRSGKFDGLPELRDQLVAKAEALIQDHSESSKVGDLKLALDLAKMRIGPAAQLQGLGTLCQAIIEAQK